MRRREFIGGLLSASAVSAFVASGESDRPPVPLAQPTAGRKFYAFSRVYQFLGIDGAVELLKRCGYDGIEWTVRPGGFVEPAKARRDLPRALAAAEKAGLENGAIVCEFLDPYADGNLELLKVAADCGVREFRTAYFQYEPQRSIHENLSRIRAGFAALDRAARETGLRFVYQNHSTYNRDIPLFGSLVWDLWEVVRDFDPRYVGVQYDVMHARAESGPSWQRGMELVAPWIATLCLKDFKFGPAEKHPGDWKRVLTPAGEGIVPWGEFRALCRKYNISVPYSVHYDYAFPTERAGAEKHAREDLEFFRRNV